LTTAHAQAAERAGAAAGDDASVTATPQERQLTLARLLTFSPVAANRARGLRVLQELEADGEARWQPASRRVSDDGDTASARSQGTARPRWL